MSSESEPAASQQPEEVPAAVEPEPPQVAAPILACCVVNSVMSLQVVIDPTASALQSRSTTGPVPFPAEVAADTAEQFNGHYELKFIFVTPSAIDTAETAADNVVHRIGRVILTGASEQPIVCYLGPLQRAPAVISATLLDALPTTIELEVVVVAEPGVHPSELILVDHCASVLRHDEFCGSMSSSHVQNQVRELPFYNEVIGRSRPQWNDFVKAHHPAAWGLFKYTQEEIDVNGLGSTCRTKEVRMYAPEHESAYRAGDIARDQVRARAEQDLNKLLLAKLEVRPHEQSELLDQLIHEKSFLTLITPNIMKILGMYEALPERYFVLKDPYHPIRIEPRRKVAPALVYDRVSRTMVPAPRPALVSPAPSTIAMSVDDEMTPAVSRTTTVARRE